MIQFAIMVDECFVADMISDGYWEVTSDIDKAWRFDTIGDVLKAVAEYAYRCSTLGVPMTEVANFENAKYDIALVEKVEE